VITHTIQLNNLGLADAYTLTVSGNTWPTGLQVLSPVAIGASSSINIPVTVQIPPTMAEVVLDSDVFTLTVQSTSDPLILLSATGTTQSNINPGLRASPAVMSRAGSPGAVISQTVTVENTGDYVDTYSLSVTGNQWQTTGPSSTGPVQPGGSVDLEFLVTIPQQPAPDVIIASDWMTVTAISGWDPAASAHVMRITNANVNPAVTMSPATQSGAGMPGDVMVYTFNITNTGDYTDSFDLNVSGNAWISVAPVSTDWLAPGAAGSVDVQVHIPADIPPEVVIASDQLTLQAVSHWDSLIAASVGATTTANVDAGLALPPVNLEHSGFPGETVTYTYRITNTGSYTDAYHLSLAGNLWQTSVPASSGPLGSGESKEVQVAVEIPISPPGEAVNLEMSDSFTLTVTSHWDATVTAQVSGRTTSTIIPGVSLGGNQATDGYTGGQAVFVFSVANTGNFADIYDLSVSSDWSASLSITRTELILPGQSGMVTLTVDVPSGVVEFTTDTATLTAVSSLDASVTSVGLATTTAVWNRLYLPSLSR
jgi:uncharacterized membrane protein